MAISWGPESGYHSVGIDISITGTTATIDYYVRHSGTAVADNQTMRLYGAITGTYNYYMGTAHGTPVRVARRQITLPRGTKFAVGASISGVYNGAAPAHTRDATIPAAAPSKMARPTVTGITPTRAIITGTAPSANGAAISGYTFQYATNPAFTQNVASADREGPRHEAGREPNTTYWVRVRANNSAGAGPWSDSIQFKTLTATPAAPSSLTLTGDILSWTLNPTENAPITGVQIERNDGTGWRTIATIGAVTSYSLVTSGREENKQYEYRAIATNAHGRSAYSTTVTEYTTPATAFNLSARKNPAGNIVLSWENGASYPVQSQVYASNNQGSTWSLLATTALSATSYTHVAPSETSTWTYSIIPVRGALTGERSSISNVVTLLAPPLVPRLLAPENGAVRVADEETEFAWQHQATDYTPQTFAQVEIDGSTYTVTGEAETYSHTLATGTHTYRVRTRGRHASYGPWSETRTFTSYPRPLVSLQAPTGDTSDITATFAVDQVVRSWTATLIQDGQQLEQVTGTDFGPIVFQTLAENFTGYELHLTVVAVTGIAALPALVTFETDFLTPPAPTVDLSWDRQTGAIYLNVQTPDPEEDEQEAVFISVFRRIDEGPRELVADELDTSFYLLDNQASLGGVNTYDVYTHSADGTVALTTAEITVPGTHNSCWTFVNYGPDYSQFVRVKGHQFEDVPAVDTALHKFAGRTKPFPVWGEAETRACTFTSNPLREREGDSPFSQWRQMLQARAKVLYRDCTGRRIFGTITNLTDSDNAVKITIEEAEE